MDAGTQANLFLKLLVTTIFIMCVCVCVCCKWYLLIVGLKDLAMMQAGDNQD